MRGRKPKPTVLKDLHGSQEPRNPAEPIAEIDLTDDPENYPAYFADEHRALWDRTMKHAPPGLLKQIDGPMVEMFVVSLSAFRDAAREHAKTRKVDQDGKSSPAIIAMRGLATVGRALASELGFSPTARTRINSVVAGAPLGGTAAYERVRDAASTTLEDYLASAPSPKTVN
jgi:phage terminase small subunit